MCDNCVRPATAPVEVTEAAQKLLSCVVRTGQKFGAGHIINVLRGSRAQAVLKWEHDKLSTHGIGQAHSEQEWKHLLQQFLQQGLLTHELTHGTLSVSEKGWAVLRGGEPVWGVFLTPPPATTAVAPITYEVALFDQLHKARKGLADAAGVPPYMIFADRTLQELATYLPHSVESLGAIYGIGRAKIERYGDAVLTLIHTYCREHDLAERAKTPRAAPRLSIAKARSDEVGELFAAGRSLDALAEQFQVKRQTVIANLTKYAEAGQAVDADRLQSESTLPPAQQHAALAAFAELGDQYLKPIFDALGQTVDYQELHLLRLVYRLRRQAPD